MNVYLFQHFFLFVCFVLVRWLKFKSCSFVSAQRLERLRKERQNQIKCKNIQWKERTSSQSGNSVSPYFENENEIRKHSTLFSSYNLLHIHVYLQGDIYYLLLLKYLLLIKKSFGESDYFFMFDLPNYIKRWNNNNFWITTIDQGYTMGFILFLKPKGISSNVAQMFTSLGPE